jgi:hypothetical protein
MGLIGHILGAGRAAGQIGDAVGGVAEVFVGNRAARDAAEHASVQGSREQYAGEFALPRETWFDRAVDGLNRLPRPMLALGTLGLFVYAMAAPDGFARRMEGLGLVPEPLWWLLGAIVSFYFGARELHYQRVRSVKAVLAPFASPLARPAAARQPDRPGIGEDEPAAAPAATVGPATVGPAGPVARFVGAAPDEIRADDPDFNAAVEEWRRSTG